MVSKKNNLGRLTIRIFSYFRERVFDL